MLVDVNDSLKINTERIDFISFNSEEENPLYTVAVNGRMFSLTQEEYNKLGINNYQAK